MKNLNHKIIIFLDNTTCHPNVKLTNIQLSFLPPNTSLVCQPLDLGVIKAFKAQYRKKLLRHKLANLDNASSSSELTKRVTVLYAVSWIICAQNAIEPAVVIKCFWNAGFGMAPSSISLTPDEDVDTTCLKNLISRVTNNDITSDQFVSFEDHVETSNTETDIARIVASISTVDGEEEGELQIPEVYSEDVKNLVKSYREALSMIQKLEEFSKKKACTTSLHLWMVKYEYEKQLTYQCKTVQTNIDNFFKRT
jgi:hypothetical protein